MMMPANFSAIAENEMTYVVGGGIEEYLAPAMTASNWQTFNSNLITIVGNAAMDGFLKATVGAIFGGSYAPGNVGRNIWGGIVDAYGTGIGAEGIFQFKGQSDFVTGVNGGLVKANGVLNAGLKVISGLAAIYTLGHGDAASLHTWNLLQA